MVVGVANLAKKGHNRRKLGIALTRVPCVSDLCAYLPIFPTLLSRPGCFFQLRPFWLIKLYTCPLVADGTLCSSSSIYPWSRSPQLQRLRSRGQAQQGSVVRGWEQYQLPMKIFLTIPPSCDVIMMLANIYES